MAKSRRPSGEGWSFEAADSNAESPEIRESLPPEQQRPRARCEKRNKGKLVTVIGPFVLSPSDLAKLGKALKKRCGSGGSIQGEFIELQGDCIEGAKSYLETQGYSVRA